MEELVKGRQNMKDVAGATQFFRRECFESLGGLVAIPEGGWDAITCFVARANGFRTATFPELIVEHLKPRNASQGNVISRKWQTGIREYALGNHPLFVDTKMSFTFFGASHNNRCCCPAWYLFFGVIL